MDPYLKRKMDSSSDKSPPKKPKRENCPHAEGCYRRNPHHFKQYEHPHLVKFIEMGDNLKIPEGSSQPKSVYLEQIAILKPILESCTEKPTKEIVKNHLKPENKGNAAATKIISAKNPELKPYSMPDLDLLASTSSGRRVSGKGKATYGNTYEENVVAKPGTMLEKLQRAAPYNIFFTTVIKASQTQQQPNGITFTDLLCPSLGTLKCSLQINFMIDIDWLLKQYKARGVSTKPLTILYGDDWPDMAKFIDMFCPNITYKLWKMKDPFGVHHSKVGIYVYEDGSLRVVVSTANLYYEDWNHYNQGLWLSPKCPKLPDSSSDTDGESPTGFKSTLLNYMRSYNEPILKTFIDFVKRADFRDVRVFLVHSVPGSHQAKSMGSHLHRVADLLSRHCMLPQKTTPQSEGPLSWGIIAQASSIGSMGKTPAEWLRGSLLRSLASHKNGAMPMSSNATLSIVYPSVDNVMKGYFGPESGGCLPYSKATNEKQKWLQSYMHQWKAEPFGRTRAMPHIKTYCRVSPCLTKLAFYLITSANLSKSAWGGPFNKSGGTYVRSYEVGVMFLPKFFDEEYFEIQNTVNRKNNSLFPFMYDLPLTPYKKDDYPWCN